MLVNNKEILISSIEVKKNGKNEEYLLIGLLTLDDGTNFNVLEKDMQRLEQIKSMNKYRANLKVTSNQYGINVSISDILKDEGNILNNFVANNNKDPK